MTTKIEQVGRELRTHDALAQRQGSQARRGRRLDARRTGGRGAGRLHGGRRRALARSGRACPDARKMTMDQQPASRPERGSHLRHHAARRRAVARRDAEHRGEAGDRPAAGAPARGHHRGRLPHRQPRRLRGRAARGHGGRHAPTGPIIAGLARAQKADIDRAWEAVRRAAQPRIHTFLATIRHPPQVQAEDHPRASASRRCARWSAMPAALCPDVEFSPEDAGRSDPEFLHRGPGRGDPAPAPPR